MTDDVVVAYRRPQALQLGLLIAVLRLPPDAGLVASGQIVAIAAGESGDADSGARTIGGQRSGDRMRNRRRVEIDQRGDGLVQESPIMTGEQHRSAPRQQDAAQIGRRVIVQMVRGLIEKQHVGGAQQQPGQRQPGALAAGDLAREAIGRQVVQAEACKHRSDPCVDIPSLEPLGVVQCLGVAGGRIVVVRIGSHLRCVTVHRRQDVARRCDRGLQRLCNGIARGERRVLVEQPNARSQPRSGIDRHRTRIGRQQPGDDPQQRRLARAVLADDAHPFVGGDHERDIGEYPAVGEGERDTVDAQMSPWQQR